MGYGSSLYQKAEFPLADTKKKRSGVLEEPEIKLEDSVYWTSEGSSDETWEKDGLDYESFVRLEYGLTDIGAIFRPVCDFRWRRIRKKSKILRDSVPTTPGAPIQVFYQFGLKYDGLGLLRPIPFFLEWKYQNIASAKNVLFSLEKNQVSLNFYLKI